MEDINVETVRAAINESNPVLEALSILLREVSADATHALAGTLTILGIDPATLPGEYLLQAMLVESERVFAQISRENWIKIWDSYQQVKAVIDANPELQAEANKKSSAMDKLLDGNF